MKHLVKIAGLCLASMLVLGMAIASSASAAHWLQCRENAGTGTKWTESKCSTASSSGKWEWRELETTEAVKTEGTLILKDTNVVGKTVTVQCSGTDEGTIGPKQFDRTTVVTTASCSNVENCGGTIKAKAVNLPWQTMLRTEANGEIRDEIVSEVAGKEPGWEVTCTGVKDTCEANTTTAMENVQSKGVVNAIFDSKSAKAKCSGGTLSGEVTGRIVNRSSEGWAIRVS
jgi:hypothetical protein